MARAANTHLLFGLAATAALTFATACGGGSPAPVVVPTATTAPVATPTVSMASTTPPATLDTRVFVWPKAIKVMPGQTFQVKVWLNPGDIGVSAADISAKVEAGVLAVSDIRVGEALGKSPIVGHQSIQGNTGDLRVALARVGITTAPTQPGSLITVILRSQESAKPGEYPISLQASLTNEKFESPVVAGVLGGTVTVE